MEKKQSKKELVLDVKKLRSERDGYREAYEKAWSERVGYREAYEKAWSEREGYREAYEKAWSERIGFKMAYEIGATKIAAYEHAPPRLRPRQLCFMHIGKAAGTSLQNLLISSFCGVPVFQGSPENFDESDAQKLADYGLILGHFSLHHASKFRPGYYLATMFRDPVDRVISSYYFLRSQTSNLSGEDEDRIKAAKSLSFKQFLLSENANVQAVTCNHQSRYLVDDWRTPTVLTEMHVKEAIDKLIGFDFIGLTEAYDESVIRLFADIGLARPSQRDKLNVTAERMSAIDLLPEVRALIEQLNSADRVVYEEAKRRFRESCSWHARRAD